MKNVTVQHVPNLTQPRKDMKSETLIVGKGLLHQDGFLLSPGVLFRAAIAESCAAPTWLPLKSGCSLSGEMYLLRVRSLTTQSESLEDPFLYRDTVHPLSKIERWLQTWLIFRITCVPFEKWFWWEYKLLYHLRKHSLLKLNIWTSMALYSTLGCRPNITICTCAPRDQYENILSSITPNSQKLQTTKMPVNSRMNKFRCSQKIELLERSCPKTFSVMMEIFYFALPRQ